MSLVFAGVCSHAPGITGRTDRADPKLKDGLYAAFDRMRQALEATRPDVLIVIAAEHFANFFINNMPSTGARQDRAGSRFVRSSPSPERRKGVSVSSGSMSRFRSLRSAARWR